MSEHNQGAPFRIIEAADTPMSIGQGDLALTIAWPDGSETVEHVSEQAAAALGYRRPDEPPAPPVWIIEVARDANALVCEAARMPGAAAAYRSGTQDAELVISRAVYALRLAIERGHVVEPREWTEEELLKAAREDAAQGYDALGRHGEAKAIRQGARDTYFRVEGALQARRNMLREGAVGAQAMPAPHLEAAARKSWIEGFGAAKSVLAVVLAGDNLPEGTVREACHREVAAILSTLPTREA